MPRMVNRKMIYHLPQMKRYRSIYPPQAKEHIVDLPDEILDFEYKSKGWTLNSLQK